MNTPASHFFLSYSQEEIHLQRRIVAELRDSILRWIENKFTLLYIVGEK